MVKGLHSSHFANRDDAGSRSVGRRRLHGQEISRERVFGQTAEFLGQRGEKKVKEMSVPSGEFRKAA
jgi:hypothetical protein